MRKTELNLTILKIQSEIQDIRNDVAPNEELNFETRAEAIDHLNFCIIDRIELLKEKHGRKKELLILKENASKLKNALEAIDNNLFAHIRGKIQTAEYVRQSLKYEIEKYINPSSKNIADSGMCGYDNLDIFMNGILPEQNMPEQTVTRESEMVFYQKTPARLVFELADMIGIGSDDVFIDLGSGLGQVVVLIHLLTGIKAKGVEFEPSYCSYAMECSSKLNLHDIKFINADARSIDYSEMTLFYLYDPFKGALLMDILKVLKQESQKRKIKIYSYGDCSFLLAQEDWLKCSQPKVDDVYKLYEFVSLETSDAT
ncbi:MAG: hypothetical protein ABI091_00800 [Ferruginibacter sp.]